MNKVAMILSVYKTDRLDFLRICLDSLLNQTYKKTDIYIQKGCVLPDELDAYLKEVALHNNVYIFDSEEDNRFAESLNDLLRRLLTNDYDYFARMDTDDISFASRIEQQVTYMNAHPDVDICGGYIEEMTEDEKTIGIVKYPLEHENCRLLMGKRNPLAHVTVMFRRSFFEKAGLYPINTVRDEDSMLWLNGFIHRAKFANLPIPLVRVRVNDDFYLRRNGKEKSLTDYMNRKKIIHDLNLPKKYYVLAYTRYLLFAFSSPRILRLAYNKFRK